MTQPTQYLHSPETYSSPLLELELVQEHILGCGHHCCLHGMMVLQLMPTDYGWHHLPMPGMGARWKKFVVHSQTPVHLHLHGELLLHGGLLFQPSSDEMHTSHAV